MLNLLTSILFLFSLVEVAHGQCRVIAEARIEEAPAVSLEQLLDITLSYEAANDNFFSLATLFNYSELDESTINGLARRHPLPNEEIPPTPIWQGFLQGSVVPSAEHSVDSRGNVSPAVIFGYDSSNAVNLEYLPEHIQEWTGGENEIEELVRQNYILMAVNRLRSELRPDFQERFGELYKIRVSPGLTITELYFRDIKFVKSPGEDIFVQENVPFDQGPIRLVAPAESVIYR